MSTRAPDTLQAACRPGNGHDPDLWHPNGNTGPALLQIEEAKAVCHGCPVMDQCLDWALETGQDHGVWGGMSEHERRLYKRRTGRRGGPRHKAPCGTTAAYRRHFRSGETPCFPCSEANRLAQQEKAEKKAKADRKAIGRPPAPCGTNSAYSRHVRNHEPIDDACRRAHSEAAQHWRDAERAAA